MGKFDYMEKERKVVRGQENPEGGKKVDWWEREEESCRMVELEWVSSDWKERSTFRKARSETCKTRTMEK